MWCSTVGVMVTLTLSILAAPLVTDAQQPTKVYRIGYLTPGSAPLSQSTPLLHAFRQRLR